MTEELTEDKNVDKTEDGTKWHADGELVYDQYNNIVCECYGLGCLDPEYSWDWAKRNASEIAFLHNVRLEKDKIISQAGPISKEEIKEDYQPYIIPYLCHNVKWLFGRNKNAILRTM